jgi:hypothetical protein
MRKSFLIFILIATIISCDSNNTTTYYNVKYEVTGTSSGGFDVYVNNSSDGNDSFNPVSSGWTKTYEMKSDDFAYISAQANGTNAKVTVKIYVNGSKWKETTSSGSYCIATASCTI